MTEPNDKSNLMSLMCNVSNSTTDTSDEYHATCCISGNKPSGQQQNTATFSFISAVNTNNYITLWFSMYPLNTNGSPDVSIVDLSLVITEI